MNPKWRRLAPLGLYLALLAALVSIGLFVIYRTFGLPLKISLALFVVGLSLYGVLNPGGVLTAFTGRRFRFGLNAAVMVIGFLGILVVVNYLSYQTAMLYPERTRTDLTEDKENSLAPETLDVLNKLPEPVIAQAFFSKRMSSSQAEDLLGQYKAGGKGQFTYELIDPEEKPEAARTAKITADGQIALKMGEKQQLVTIVSETELTSGLIRLLSSETRTIYFLTGHGEYNPEDTGDASYAKAKSALEDRNYAVKVLNLRATGDIPEDARVIVIAGPRQPVTEEEVNWLSAFVDGGGALMVMEDPIPWTDFGDSPDPLAGYLSNQWGIFLGNDVVIKVAANQPSIMADVYQVAEHAITEKLANQPPIFPGARSVLASQTTGDISRVEMIYTTPIYDQCFPACSWAASDLTAVTAWLNNEGEVPQPSGNDILGPVCMGVAAENSATQARVVVFGDSDFASNGFFTAYGNDDLMINALDWLAGQEELITLTPKNTTQRMLVPPWSIELTKNLLLLGFVFVLPGLVIVAGVVSWIIRRRRG
jgi:ABC-type uncharacterized transport system involved in gliding motility auxiliary subunit